MPVRATLSILKSERDERGGHTTIHLQKPQALSQTNVFQDWMECNDEQDTFCSGRQTPQQELQNQEIFVHIGEQKFTG